MKPECKKYYRDDGSIEAEEWCLNGKCHRIDGPAIVRYREDGSVEEKSWCLNGKYHRIDGPAIIYYRKDGGVEVEKWCLNGNLHRTDSPAVIDYNKNGSVEIEHWFLNGKRIDPKEHLMPMPKTEEEKIILINKIVFIKENNKYILIKEWLKRDKKFYEKYRVLFE